MVQPIEGEAQGVDSPQAAAPAPPGTEIKETEKCQCDEKRTLDVFQGSCLKTLPSFMTKCTCINTSMLLRGSPETATTSANAPGAITPRSPFISSNSAAREVADLMASIGLIPNFTIYPNSLAIGSVHG